MAKVLFVMRRLHPWRGLAALYGCRPESVHGPESGLRSAFGARVHERIRL